MRKTSHDGVDTTSITSGIESEVKKSSATGIIKIKKSSIKRKVPNFSHESDDGIVEPLLQSDKEKSETAPRSAKYLMSKTKTDSISENEDSIKMSEINLSNISASTPITAANKGITTMNMNNVKDNNVSNVNEETTLRNHMNTNIFCVPEAAKTIISTKSPMLVELDAAKTTGYNPSLIFTTAKIHSDCKTKLMEPVQLTPVPIISTTEKDVIAAGSLTENKHEIKEVKNKTIDSTNNVFDSNKGLSKDVKSNLETDIRTTSNSVSNIIEKPPNKCEENMPNSSLSKNTVGNNILLKTDIKSSNVIDSSNNTKQISKGTENVAQTKQITNMTQPTKPNVETIEKSVTKNSNLPSSSIKSPTEQTSNEKNASKITVQGSKKLQRQKKATVEESQDTTSLSTIIKDKASSEESNKPTVSQIKTIIGTSTAPTTIAIAKLPSSQTSFSKSNNIAKNVTPTGSTKMPSQVGSAPKATDSKMQTPVSNSVISQPTLSSKIPSQVGSIPKTTETKIQTPVSNSVTSQPKVCSALKATDSKVQTSVNKNLKPQSTSTASSKISSQDVTTPKLPDGKFQTPVSKIPTPTTPVSNITTKSITQIPASKTVQGGIVKTAASNKKGENFDSVNKSESSHQIVTKSGAKEVAPVATEKSSPVPKTLPPYIVSTSKTKIGAPVVTSATLKSEANKSVSDFKSPTNSYLVKTIPVTSIKTTTSSVPMPVATSATSKLEGNKPGSDSKSTVNSTCMVKTTPATSLKTTTTTVPITSSSSSQGSKQTAPVKQTKSNTEKQKGGSKA